MNKWSNYWNEPFPPIRNPWMIIAIATFLVVFILGVFQPFEFNLNKSDQWFVLAGFGTATFLVTSLFYIVLPYFFKRFYLKDWTVKRDFINNFLLLCTMGIVVFLIDFYVLRNGRNAELLGWLFLMDMISAFTIGIIPVGISYFIRQNRSLKENLQESIKINQLLAERIERKEEQAPVITLSGSTKEAVKVQPDNIYYMEASGNYIMVVYEEDGKKQKQIRTTLKRLEEELKTYPFFIRCHRAFIINTRKILSIQGNALGYKVTLSGVKDEVPVSRNYIGILKENIT